MNRILNILLVFAIFFAVSCKKEKFSCTITNPYNGQEFTIEEDIQVSVTTNDNHASILLYMDNQCYSGTADFPYHFTIKAGEITQGKHDIKVIAQNDDGKQCEASVSISITAKEHESPDLVTFSDGQLPAGWETIGWNLIPDDSYIDHFSLFTRADNAIVKTSKTCNYIEFFLRGYGIINLYMDGNLLEDIGIGTWDPAGSLLHSWKKYAYDLPEGYHTFTWEFMSRSSVSSIGGLDAITFKTL